MRRAILAGILAGATLLGLGWWRYHARPDSGFAGSSSCRDCHPSFYRLWSTSHHGLAMQPFTPEFGYRQLTWSSGSIRSGNSTYVPAFGDNRGWVEEHSPAETRRYAIEHAMGGKNIYYFLTMLDRGRLQVLPLAYDVRSKSWIDATTSMTVHDLGLAAQPLHWRDPMLTFNTSCLGCHVSQIATNYDASPTATIRDGSNPESIASLATDPRPNTFGRCGNGRRGSTRAEPPTSSSSA
jgi:hypothetical protein